MAKEETITPKATPEAGTTTEPIVATDTAEATTAPAAAPKKKKVKRAVPVGQVHILATFNNTIVTVTDPNGSALVTASAGSVGFRGSKKGTAYAAQVAAEKALELAKQQYGLSRSDVFIKGVGLGRDSAVRALTSLNIQVEGIKDVTGMPHGGVRPKKARRV
jgi:small subunit ribosomal protein S11